MADSTKADLHCCTGCFQEWDVPPPVDERGCHADSNGEPCAGPINCFPATPAKTKEGA